MPLPQDVDGVPIALGARAGEAVEVERAALATIPGMGHGAGPERVAAYLRHTGYPEHLAVGAVERGTGRLVGFTYGYLDRPGQWWHEQVAPAMTGAGTVSWLEDAYCLVELHVLPERHGQGVGVALLRALLAGTSRSRVVLSTGDTESRGRALYRHLGFVDLLTGFRFEGVERDYAVMGRALPLGPLPRSRPDGTRSRAR
ncbi:MAG: GNAT family N-acetyltransferase [Motilibacteraceae bacterium]